MKKIWAILLVLLSLPVLVDAVNLTWDASVSPEVTGYKLHYGTESGVYTTTIDVGNVLTYTIDDGMFTPGSTQYIAATAYAPDVDDSGYSNEVTYTVSTPPTGSVLMSVTANP
jgi:hypothetical protein